MDRGKSLIDQLRHNRFTITAVARSTGYSDRQIWEVSAGRRTAGPNLISALERLCQQEHITSAPENLPSPKPANGHQPQIIGNLAQAIAREEEKTRQFAGSLQQDPWEETPPLAPQCEWCGEDDETVQSREYDGAKMIICNECWVDFLSSELE